MALCRPPGASAFQTSPKPPPPPASYNRQGTVGPRGAAAVPHYALSLKQPWAALLAAGRKTVEVRRWPTPRRGPVLIHAARVPDPRPQAWALVPPELAEAA